MKAALLYGIVRHLLTFGGGAVVATSQEQFSAEAIGGAILTLVGFAWSLYEKAKRARK